MKKTVNAFSKGDKIILSWLAVLTILIFGVVYMHITYVQDVKKVTDSLAEQLFQLEIRQ